jgi:hypothetical protein
MIARREKLCSGGDFQKNYDIDMLEFYLSDKQNKVGTREIRSG